MRFTHPTLQLLALCSTALASPCKPSASSVTTALTSSTEEPSLSTTQLPTISEGVTTVELTSEPSASTTEALTASETATTTTSAEPSTTTSDLPQEPSNLLLNPGFEENAVAPWERSGYYGDPTLSTSEAHGGSQSGYISAVPGGPADIGFRQRLDASLFEADKPYTFSVYVKVTVAGSCFTRFVSCDYGTGSQTGYFTTANIAGPLDEWVLATVTCSWSQARLDSGISVAVRGVCERLSFYIDDAVIMAAE